MSGSPWQTFRSFTRDQSVARHKLTKGTLRRVAGFAQPHLRAIVIFLALVVVSSGLVVASPLIFKVIVDDGIIAGNASLVTWLALLVALLAITEAALGLVQRWYSSRIGEGLIYDLRTRVFSHVLNMPVAFFTRTQTGALVSRLNTDVVGAQRAFTSVLSGLLSNVISVVLVVGAMALLSWQITLLALVMLPLFLLPARWAGRRLSDLNHEQMSVNAEMSTTMTERFNSGGANLVKLFGRIGEESDQFGQRAERVQYLGVRIAMVSRVFFTSLTLVAALATALAYGIGGNLVVSGELTIGTLLALVALLARLYGPLTALSNVHVDVMTALVSFERVFEVLDLEPSITEKPDAIMLPPDAASVELDHVTFQYPRADEVSLVSLQHLPELEHHAGVDVLHDVSLRAGPGQLIALVGPSGAGKTTITHLLARLYDVSDGAVRVGGHDVRDLTLDSLHAAVGYVTQDVHLFHASIGENLHYAKPDATDEEIADALKAAQVWDLVQSLPDGLDTVVGDRGYRLSGGERQRVAIARLLLKSPRIVVLDEATAHLDSGSEAAVQRALDTALADRTAIVIAHRLSTVRNADMVLVVDDGRIVERGTHSELVEADGLYAFLYRTQLLPAARNEVAETSPA